MGRKLLGRWQGPELHHEFIPLPPRVHVPYLFRMADRAIRFTSDLVRYFASARIKCTRCAHATVVSGEQMIEMFPVAMKLELIPYRMCCKACGQRVPMIEVLAKPPRD